MDNKSINLYNIMKKFSSDQDLLKNYVNSQINQTSLVQCVRSGGCGYQGEIFELDYRSEHKHRNCTLVTSKVVNNFNNFNNFKLDDEKDNVNNNKNIKQKYNIIDDFDDGIEWEEIGMNSNPIVINIRQKRFDSLTNRCLEFNKQYGFVSNNNKKNCKL